MSWRGRRNRKAHEHLAGLGVIVCTSLPLQKLQKEKKCVYHINQAKYNKKGTLGLYDCLLDMIIKGSNAVFF